MKPINLYGKKIKMTGKTLLGPDKKLKMLPPVHILTKPPKEETADE